MEVVDKRTLGRLSRASVGGMTFDVETEAQLNDTPQVRTYVFLDGRIVDRVVWEFEANDSRSGPRLVTLQHESVVRHINLRMVNGMPEDDPRVIGTLPPPKADLSAPPEEKRLVESIRPIPSPPVPSGVAPTPRALEQPVEEHAAPPKMPFREGAIIDDEATSLVEVGAAASTFAELAFLVAGLDALLARNVTLGRFEHAVVETREGPALVARHNDLIAAFRVDRKGPHARAITEVRQALADLEATT